MTPPKIIYLQWYDDNGEELDPHRGGEVTWCEDRINDSDAVYMLVDGAPIAELGDPCTINEQLR